MSETAQPHLSEPAEWSKEGAAERYADFGKGVPALERRPDDGWVLARPFPMGRPARLALRGLTRVLCPPAPAPQLPDLEDRIEREARTLMCYMPLPVAWGLRIALRLLDQTPRLLFMSWSRLHRLDTPRALEVVHKLAASRIGPVRELVGVARSLILSIYYDQDELHEAIGYAPIPFMRARIDLRQRLLAGEPPTDADRIAVTPGLEP